MSALVVAGIAAAAAAAAGAMKAYGSAQQAKAQRRDKLNARQGMVDQYESAYGDIKGMYSPYAALSPMALKMLQEDYSVDPGEFTYDKTVRDFLDPSIAYQQEQARKSLEGSAASRGSLLSGAAQKALQDRAMQVGQTGYNNAFSQMMTDKNQLYRQYSEDFLRRQQEAQRLYGQAQDINTLAQWGVTGQANARQQMASGVANAYGQTADIPTTAGMGWTGTGQATGAAANTFASFYGMGGQGGGQAQQLPNGLQATPWQATQQYQQQYQGNPYMQPQPGSFTNLGGV